MATPRETLAWLMWCYEQGYMTPEDRAVGGGNWIADEPDDRLHPDDVTTKAALLEMAGEVLAALDAEVRGEQPTPAACGCDLTGMAPPAVHIVDDHDNLPGGER